MLAGKEVADRERRASSLDARTAEVATFAPRRGPRVTEAGALAEGMRRSCPPRRAAPVGAGAAARGATM